MRVLIKKQLSKMCILESCVCDKLTIRFRYRKQ